MMLGYEHLLDKKNIWNIKQNKPSLIAGDLLLFGVPKEITHKVLLARGVYKWLAVRRKLIVLKNIWKSRITSTIEQLKVAKTKENNAFEVGYLRGYLKAHEECRKEVRELCHSERWQAPDFDRDSNNFLVEMESNHV